MKTLLKDCSLCAKLPGAIAAGLQAGILFSFGTEVFRALPVQPALVLAMFATYVSMRKLRPRYAVAAVLAVGVAVTLASGQLRSSERVMALTTPLWTTPQFSWAGTFSLALPMVLVALTGQFMPGMAVLRNAGYAASASPLISASAVGGLLLAPFGCHGLNLAAVTASLRAAPRRWSRGG